MLEKGLNDCRWKIVTINLGSGELSNLRGAMCIWRSSPFIGFLDYLSTPNMTYHVNLLTGTHYLAPFTGCYD